MNAKEYLSSKNWGDSDFLDSGLWMQICEWMEEYYQHKLSEITEEEIDTQLLDAINSGLFKWGFKKKLPFDDAFELLTCLQDTILNVKFLSKLKGE